MKSVNTPADIKHMTPEELNALADELRQEIIATVSKNGGHLSSNLGIVELTIALHYVFDTPVDKLVFDVGHQSYAHKLLTGRRERFSELRKANGLCGFPKTSESKYDCFTAGHASTAISAALGLARARDLAGETHEVVAIVGDGALSGGMCYEALNDAGQSNTRLIVILNDNKMSISRNVGAMSRYLTHLRQSRTYSAVKRGVRSGLERIPVIGTPLFRVFERIKNSLKTLLIDGKFFSALGFEYIGPVDGHDIKRLIRILSKTRSSERPVLLHVVTQKGRGYKPAEDQPDIYHGIAPFYVDSGLPRSGNGSTCVSCGTFVGQTLVRFAEVDEHICAVTAAMESGTGLEAFHAAYKERFFDVGIAEEHAVVMAAGLASGGFKPYVAIYSTFLQRAVDQILIDVCRNSLPVVFLLDRSGLVGADGDTHQGVFDLSYLRMMPNIVLAAPRDIRQLEKMLEQSRSANGPFAIRYPRALPEDIKADVASGGDSCKPGTWQLICNGSDITLFAEGRMVASALTAREWLRAKGISCAVVDARYVKPLDESMLCHMAKTNEEFIVVEDNTVIGGLGDAITAAVRDLGLNIRIRCFGIPDRFIEQGSVDEQMDYCGLTAQRLTESILQAFEDDGKKEDKKTAC